MLSALMAGCGSEVVTPEDEGTDVQPDVVITVDVDPDVGNTDDGRVDAINDVTETGTDVTPDVATEIPEDNDPPVVYATYPENEESGVTIPFIIRVTFNEDINFALVNAQTFKVYDINDEEVDGTLGYDPVSFTVTFEPDAGIIINKGTPYRVWLSNLIQDMHGNRMAEYTFRFATESFPQMDLYLPVAAKYAPILYQSTTQAAPQWDYPTTFNFDGDWSATNNLETYSEVTSIPPAVYYDVIETATHFFIRYAYFYVKHTESETDFGNEVAGAMVVVQKNPEEPIAVETYFGAMSKEDVRSFVTTESGLVTDRNTNGSLIDDDRKYYGVNWVFPKAELFPNGHFQNYLTTGTHESCAWMQTNKENAMDFRCDLKTYTKPNLKIVHFAYKGGAASNITTPFPYSNAEGNEIGYALRPLMDDWWIRRDRTAKDEVFSSLVRYEAPDGLVGNNMAMPRSFQNSMSASVPGGRPPFSWGWNPTVPDPNFYFREFPEGTIFLHPAYYFALRHRMTLTDGNTGFSGQYCFNPYLLIDRRGVSGDCTPLE